MDHEPRPANDQPSEDEKKIRNELRGVLRSLEQTNQTAYDKAVMTLFGGALGGSIAVLKDVVGTQVPVARAALVFAWAAWALSLTCILLSFYCSVRAQRHAQRKLEDGSLNPKRPGGPFDTATTWFNVFAGGLFVVGVFLFIIFATKNLGPTDGKNAYYGGAIIKIRSVRQQEEGNSQAPPNGGKDKLRRQHAGHPARIAT